MIFEEWDHKKYLEERKKELTKELASGMIGEEEREINALEKEVSILSRDVRRRKSNQAIDKMRSVLGGSR